MQIKEVFFDQQRLRYIEVLENGLLFNAKDYCLIANIQEREPGTALGFPCVDLATAILSAVHNEVFVDWLLENFSQYEKETPVHPRCDDDWNFKEAKKDR